jgi:hypothetical protein
MDWSAGHQVWVFKELCGTAFFSLQNSIRHTSTGLPSDPKVDIISIIYENKAENFSFNTIKWLA